MTVQPPAHATRTALVAGASRGLGYLVARTLARRGLVVSICARDRAELDDAVARLAAEGVTVHPYVADVADREGLRALVAQVEAEHGPLDVAIHVAGIIQVGPLDALTPELFDAAIDVMLKGPINLALAVLPGMRERRFGRIGTVTSIGGMVSVPHLLPYSTAKFGAVGFSQGLAAELAGTGVTSTTIVPGLMRTGSHGHAQFTGDAAAEYAWFAPSASLPLLSMDAERAAEAMVDGVLAGEPMVVLSPMSKIGMRVAGVAPATTTRLMGLVARALPNGTDPGVVEGHDARADLGPVARRVVGALTVLGDRAARRTNEQRRSPFVPDTSGSPTATGQTPTTPARPRAGVTPHAGTTGTEGEAR